MLLPRALIALLAATGALALPQVSKKGRYLFTPDGNRFYVKGVSYQQQGTVSTDGAPGAFPEPTDFIDPLADAAGCARDIPYISSLKANAIRVYSVNSSMDHTACMNAFSTAGIYVILDLALPVTGSINRASPSWTTTLLDVYTDTIDAFVQYDNLLAVNIGNEVVNSDATTESAPFIKAAARDIKAYLASKGSGALVGYASTDGSDTTDDWRDPLANYLACGSEATSLDLYGLNNYRWCGAAGSFEGSWASTVAAFSNYPIPAYFSEYGCVADLPRLWNEVPVLYGSQMVGEWSGGLAFSYFPAVGGYGLVNISSDNTTVITGSDWALLQSELSNVTFINSPTSSSAQTTSPVACPGQNSSFLASTTLPPTPDAAKCACFRESAFSCSYTGSPTDTGIQGDLFNYVCNALGAEGANCSIIAANGTTGTYGILSDCDPVTQLSWAFSYYYELSNRNPQGCDFSGNATANDSVSTSGANSAAQACLASVPSGGVFTPTASSGSPSATGSGGSGSSPSQSGSKSAAQAWRVEVGALGAMAGAALAALVGAVVTLL
ncbi:carbohydrate-binding module family 43 protein [Calocera viscosa TUFC12733]|uniref:1,3-beta-glucanosyltransferase n=1 Tax=Calocera viscosa (strain TUFC12733) TaxID=1330018 RepID=A0A167RBS6_CALVF|nr:carbohydrate-binding module family 43 protein [Calocera viscosa TUFC12733]